MIIVQGREEILAALRDYREFRTAMGTLQAVRAVNEVGQLPEPHAQQYKSLLFHNDVMYAILSYDTVIGWVSRYGGAYVPDATYSAMTSKHQDMVREVFAEMLA